MAHVIDVDEVPHKKLSEEGSDDDHANTSEHEEQSVQPASGVSPRVLAAVTSARSTMSSLRSSKRAKIGAILVSVMSVVAISIGAAVYYSKSPSVSEVATEKTIPVIPQTAEPLPFLKVVLEDDGTSVFVLNKSMWNESFMVYPTVVKRSAPAQSGWERGSILLETTDYVFHFEKSFDKRFLLLVTENHMARLQDDDDEIKHAFDDSQWPGYMTRVPIYMETEDAFFFATDPFFSHGFFVSMTLSTPYYSIIPGRSAFYPRNTNIQVEYELDYGVVWVNYAIGLLPSTVMPQRVADDRVGYFMQRYVRFSVDNNDSKGATAEGYQYMDTAMTVINRRRLEMDPATNRTKDPIVYYIDPSVPKRWRDAFVKGVMAWVPAFEAIGFKDAIKAVKPGDVDWPSDYRIGDLRYNSISVMISDQTYALGPMVYDPRSGEIVHSDILFEYGFFDEVVADFDVRSPLSSPASFSMEQLQNRSHGHAHGPRQCGIGKSPQHQLDRTTLAMMFGADAGVVPEELIARHFTDIVIHEIGHTLGLRHNFAGSALVTRSELRDESFTSSQGVSTSIMDYVAANIFSDLSASAAKTHDFYQSVIGSYDKAAIAYGYSIVEDEIPGYKSAELSKLAQAAPLFLTDEDADTWTNPYAQRFDISADPIDFANDRLELVRKLRNSSLSKLADDAPASNLWRYERTMLRLINASITMVQPFLGGVNVTHAHHKAGEPPYSVPFIPKNDQLRALNVLARVIRGDDGLFPSSDQYASFIQVQGYDGEDCVGPSHDYGCLARALVNVDDAIKFVRQNAVIAAVFPVLDRIIAQDANSPLSVSQVLNIVETAASTNAKEPRNQVIYNFFHDILGFILSSDEDSRLQKEIETFVNASASR